MPEASPRKQLPLRLLAAITGVALVAFLIRRADPAKLLNTVEGMGWGLGLILALAGVSHVVKTWAWRLTLSGEKHSISFLRMFGLRLAAEAGGQLGIVGQVFGDTMRISLLSERIPVASAISSVTLDRGLFMVAGVTMTIVGIAAGLLALSLSHAMRLYAGLFSFALIGVVLVIALAIRKRWPLFSATARGMGRVPYFKRWVENKYLLIQSVENKLLDFHHDLPGAFWASLTLNLACHVMAALEVFLILSLIGSKADFFSAFLIEALTKLVNVVGLFNPGNIGTYEGGNILVAKMFGLTGSVGLALGLSRRFRSLFWGVLGGICLVVFSKSKKQKNSKDSMQKQTCVEETPASSTEAQTKRDPPGCSTIAVILANTSRNDSEFAPPLVRVGTLPILLRAILGAHKAGAGRIIVLLDSFTGPDIQREMLNAHRLPEQVEFLQTAQRASLSQSLEHIASDAGRGDRLLLIAANRTYYPGLLRKGGDWTREARALALTTASELVGIYVLPSDLTLSHADRGQPELGGLEELHAWLMKNHSVQCMPVDEGLWQSIITAEDCVSAERKLDHWLVKPTDGIFARLNRTISIRISRQIIKFPITPNMVSLFTLGVSFASGVLFAFGGYFNTLIGAALSLVASILDGCDGEVARLKLQESDFGCWLETICDYLYYLFLFVGMTIGLQKSSGTGFCVIWGGVLIFGAIMSFLATGFSRHRLAANRPEQLLGIWQTQAARRRSNAFLYIGRHTEFIVRRCFLPYAIAFFALLNITQVAFVLCAVGANVVWPIALYSCRTFTAARSRSVGTTAASV